MSSSYRWTLPGPLSENPIMNRRLLVIEDSEDLAVGLKDNLEVEGYDVDLAADGATGLRLARAAPPDLLVLDLMLPDTDGFRVLKTLRDEGHEEPVLVLSARGEETDKVRGFRLGADDYLTKPFGVLELLARIEALLRRGRPRPGDPAQRAPLSFADVEVRPATRTVLRAGREVALAPKEFDLLLALMDHEGAAVSRADLLRDVWQLSGRIHTRTVDTHVAELRRKLEPEPQNPQHILTVRKVGYRFES